MLRIILICLCLFSAPVGAAAQSADQPSGAIGVEDSAQQDAAIATRIRDILSELDGYGDVTVTVTSGIVTLRGTTLDSATAVRLNELVARVEGVVAIENEVRETTDVAERLNPAIERFVDRVEQAWAFLPLVAVAFVAFLVVVSIGILIARMRQPWDRLAPNSFISDIYRQLVRLAFVIFGIVIALDILGATALLSTILGAAGIIGLAIGFAVRDTVENFIASIMLSIRQPFRPNDAIEINGDEGKVIRLTSRATILLSWDGNHIRIPNATVFKSRIVNYSRNPERRFTFEIAVGYGTDLAMAHELAEETMRALPFILEVPAVSVWTNSFGGSDVSLTVAGWIDQQQTSLLAAKSEAMRHVWTAFANAGIEMPEPTYRLLTTGLSALPSDAPQSSPSAPVAPHVDEVAEVAATPEQQLEKIVEAEREITADDDLLRRNAPEE